MIDYFIFKPMDIDKHKADLVRLMTTVLKDNITQNYPQDLPAQYVDKLPGYINDGSAIIVGAIDGDKLAGFSWAYELAIFGERRLHIDMICVDPGYRKLGLARTFVEMQKEEARNRGIAIIEAMTTRTNENSYNWFHSLGFVDERVKVKLEID